MSRATLLPIGEDVETGAGLFGNPWLLAFCAAALPVDTALALAIAMPKLQSALGNTGLSFPRPTLWLIDLGTTWTAYWWVILPPIAALPFVVAWRWRESAVPILKAVIGLELALLAIICLLMLLPLETILGAE